MPSSFSVSRSTNYGSDRAVCALDAPRNLTRRRALRLLSSLPPARTHKLFKARIIDQTISTRIRVGLARILTATSDGIVTELATTIKATDVRLRRASATASTPTDALLDALFDEDPEVLSRAAEALLKREHPIPIGTVQTLVDHVSEVTDMFVRLVAFSNPPPEVLERFGVRGLDALKTYMTSPEWLREAFRDEPDRLAWKLGQSGVVDPLWATEGTPSQRAACARYLDSDNNILEHLASDPEPAVAWHAQRNLNGRYRTDQLRLRLDNNPIQDSPSASAPYGLRPTDVIDPTVRVEAALALCQARFNMNLGVAMRSAEAAGLGQIVFVGRRDYMRSPARGLTLQSLSLLSLTWQGSWTSQGRMGTKSLRYSKALVVCHITKLAIRRNPSSSWAPRMQACKPHCDSPRT